MTKRHHNNKKNQTVFGLVNTNQNRKVMPCFWDEFSQKKMNYVSVLHSSNIFSIPPLAKNKVVKLPRARERNFQKELELKEIIIKTIPNTSDWVAILSSFANDRTLDQEDFLHIINLTTNECMYKCQLPFDRFTAKKINCMKLCGIHKTDLSEAFENSLKEYFKKYTYTSKKVPEDEQLMRYLQTINITELGDIYLPEPAGEELLFINVNTLTKQFNCQPRREVSIPPRHFADIDLSITSHRFR